MSSRLQCLARRDSHHAQPTRTRSPATIRVLYLAAVAELDAPGPGGRLFHFEPGCDFLVGRAALAAACDAGGGTQEVALRFGVAEAWVRRAKQERREQGKVVPKTTHNWRKTWEPHAAWLLAKLDQQPDIYLRELQTASREELDWEVSDVTPGQSLGGGLFLQSLDYSGGSAFAQLSGIAGDFNANGVVDAADYVEWRNSVGQSGTSLAADGNHNDIIDEADYDMWRTKFGQTTVAGVGALASQSNHTIPEPTTLVLLGLGFVSTVTSPRRRR